MNFQDYKKQKKKKQNAVTRDKFVLLFIIIGAVYYFFGGAISSAYNVTSNFIVGITQSITINLKNFDEEQKNNITNVQQAAINMNHPDVKRMVAHLLTESNAKTVKDGDKGNGFGKKSYGPMQVKLGTVYYNKTKRPDLMTKYAPEVNTLAKEDILHKLRTDSQFNAKMGVMTHLVLIDVCGSIDRATVAYNRGKCDADSLGKEYLGKILTNERRL